MASNVEGKFQYLIETKEQIKAAIQERGQTISSSTPFREYADKIRAISGGSSDVCYVTFKNGSTTLYKKAVAIGDDCVDVLEKGILTTTPTKASTAQYHYTYSGWSKTNGGTASDTALSNVTANRTVYAAFTSSVRSYTITYYDSDGTTVLKTEPVGYGSIPSYAPTKDGFDFAGWVPTPSAVTGATSYTAKWAEKTGIVHKISVPKSKYSSRDVMDMAITNDGSLVALACAGSSAVSGPVTLGISGDTVNYKSSPSFPTALYCNACDFNYNDSEMIMIGNANNSASGYIYSVSGSSLTRTSSISANISNKIRYSPVLNDYAVGKGSTSLRTSGNVSISTSGKIENIDRYEFSPDGTTIAIYGYIGTSVGVVLYNRTTGSYIRRVTDVATSYISYNSDGSMLAVCYYSDDSRWVSVYDTSTWTEICNLEGIVTSKCYATFLGRDTLIVANGSNVLVYTVTADGLENFEYDVPTYSGGSISKIRSNHAKTHVMFLNSDGLEIWQKFGA